MMLTLHAKRGPRQNAWALMSEVREKTCYGMVSFWPVVSTAEVEMLLAVATC